MKRQGLALAALALWACGDDGERRLRTDASVSVDGGLTLDSASPDVPANLQDASGDATVADAGGDDASGGDAAIICNSGAKRCDGPVAEVCAPSGAAWNRLSCANGCDNGACKPLSLASGWQVHQFNLTDDSIPTPASYTFESEGLVAVQTANPMASVYYADTPLPEGVVVTGKFGVRTTTDDDLIGFVFGWQDPRHFYLFDWKQTNQSSGSCGLASAGASLKVVSADTELTKCADLWQSSGTAGVMPLVTTSSNMAGWKDNTDYELRLVFRPGDIQITVLEGNTPVVSITSNDTTYRSGKFGFYNYSQPSVRYEFFSISPL